MNRFLVRPNLMILAMGLAMSVTIRGTDLDKDARELEAMLIAPCCFSQQVSVHHSAAADEVRQDIRKRLAAGETREQILDAYEAQYGKRVLAEPPAEGIARMLYVLPPLVFVLTAALMWGAHLLRKHAENQVTKSTRPSSGKVMNSEVTHIDAGIPSPR